MVFSLHESPQPLQGKLDMPSRYAACPANMYADHALRLAQEIVAENFFLRLLRQKGKGGGKFRMVQNGGLAAGGKKVFFKLLWLDWLCYHYYCGFTLACYKHIPAVLTQV